MELLPEPYGTEPLTQDRVIVKDASATLRQYPDLYVAGSEPLGAHEMRITALGTGYSSLSYLKRLPIHTLKIDQSFIIDVAFDQQDVAIVRSIIDLGHNLGYKVVAEGVENGMAWDVLDKLGCDTAQGFLISKPLSDNHFSGWLADSGHTV